MEALSEHTTTASIAIVDDSPAHRTLIKRALRKANINCPVIEADSLARARRLFLSSVDNSSNLQLAIVDLNLGDGRGTELIGELRSTSRYSQLPIMVLSTSALESDIFESYEQGASCYVIKTEDPGEFSNHVAGAVTFLLALRAGREQEIP